MIPPSDEVEVGRGWDLFAAVGKFVLPQSVDSTVEDAASSAACAAPISSAACFAAFAGASAVVVALRPPPTGVASASATSGCGSAILPPVEYHHFDA